MTQPSLDPNALNIKAQLFKRANSTIQRINRYPTCCAILSIQCIQWIELSTLRSTGVWPLGRKMKNLLWNNSQKREGSLYQDDKKLTGGVVQAKKIPTSVSAAKGQGRRPVEIISPITLPDTALLQTL